VQGVWIHEPGPRRGQKGAFLEPKLTSVSLGRGIQVPVLGPAWTRDWGVRVEEGVVWNPEVRVPFVAERVPEVHAGEVVVEVRHF